MTTSAEVRRRERIALPLYFLMYAGIPVLFLVLATIVTVEAGKEYERGFDAVQLIPSVIMLAAGMFLALRRRHKPGKWAGGGGLFGAVGGLFVFGLIAIQSIGLDGELFEFLSSGFAFAVPLFGGLGWVLGWGARRVLTNPVVGDLADSRYEWTFRVRDTRRVRVDVDLKLVSLLETYSVGSGDNASTRTRGEKIPLAHLSEVGAVTTGAQWPPRLPSSIQAAPGQEPGPALVIPHGKIQWIVPVDEAEGVAQLIQRRISLARTGAI
jgi:hypothetical protein